MSTISNDFFSFFPQWQIQKVYLAQQDFKILSQPPTLNLMNWEQKPSFIFLLQNLESQIRFYVLWPTMTEEHIPATFSCPGLLLPLSLSYCTTLNKVLVTCSVLVDKAQRARSSLATALHENFYQSYESLKKTCWVLPEPRWRSEPPFEAPVTALLLPGLRTPTKKLQLANCNSRFALFSLSLLLLLFFKTLCLVSTLKLWIS